MGFVCKSEGWHFKEVSARQIRLRCLVVSTRVEKQEEDEPISDWKWGSERARGKIKERLPFLQRAKTNPRHFVPRIEEDPEKPPLDRGRGERYIDVPAEVLVA